ncbi:insulinase family protein [Thioalkalivibrio sp. HK1]|uniref:insulinase family protein n=1 Tax=Thioalkalivibrio sp. HK1 TaxID=1469245 RepID=UPI0004AD5887|nr:insulinase family protein [Thioalkalivibrio sp. HK1]
MNRILLFLFGVLAGPMTAFVSMSVLANAESSVGTIDGDTMEIKRSPEDLREYRALSLANGLRAVVVHDPGSEKAAAALSVGVGSTDDPPSRQGLAHFLEHMLFLGTEKYPDAGEYGRFISEHGGSHNASTSPDRTDYHFSVEASSLEGAMDRFAQMFIAPRLDPEYVDSERQVVHSEFIAGLRNDARRYLSAWKQTLHPSHPWKAFATGNATTLADRPDSTIEDELKAFFDRHYSAHRMTLAVVGSRSLDELEAMVREKFSSLPRRPGESLRITAPLHREGLLPARLDMQPIRESRTLSLSFVIDSLQPAYATKPLALSSHLLSRRGRGSLIEFLKAKGWALSLSARTGIDHADFATFDITVQLSEAGLSNADDIVEAIFAKIDLIRKEGIEERHYEEIALQPRLAFLHIEKTEASHLARVLASSLRRYPTEELISARYRFDGLDADLERAYLDTMVPERALITIVANDVEVDSTAPYYETPYRLHPIEPALVERWRKAKAEDNADYSFSLPERNPYLPEDLDLIEPAPSSSPFPEKIISRPGFSLWYRADAEFKKPKAYFLLSYRSPLSAATPRNALLTELLTYMAEESLDDISRQIALAGQYRSIGAHSRGIEARIYGWSDKQLPLIERVILALRDPELDAATFEREKKDLARRLRNVPENPPFRRASGRLPVLLSEPGWSHEVLLSALETIDLDDLRAFVDDFFAHGELMAFAFGNIDGERTLAFAKMLEEKLLASTKPLFVPPLRVVDIQPGQRFVHRLESEHEDHALALYRQAASADIEEWAKVSMIAQLAKERFYFELRTEREIGYVVSLYQRPVIDIPGLVFVVQSPVAAPDRLFDEIQDFIARFDERLEAMPDDLLERHRNTLVDALREPDKRMSHRADRFWRSLNRPGEPLFDRRERIAQAVSAVTKADIVSAWRRIVGDSKSARSLAVVVSKMAIDENSPLASRTEIDDTLVLDPSRRYFER